jgi:hypothetical protein
MNRLKWEGVLNIWCEPRCYPINPEILGVGSTLSDTHFPSTTTHQIPCTSLRKNNALGGILKQVAV